MATEQYNSQSGKNYTTKPNIVKHFHATYTEQCIGITFTAILMLLTMFMNILVITTILRRKPAFNTSYVFILNLCTANCLVGVFSMPWWIMLELYPFPELNQMLGYPMYFFIFVDIVAGVASILSLTAISVVRWLMVCNPLNWMLLLTRRKSLYIVSFIWMYGVIVASMKFVEWPRMPNYSLFVFLVCFLIPFSILVLAYGRMYLRAKYLRCPSERSWRTKYSKERNGEQVEILRTYELTAKFQSNFRGSRTIALVTGTFLLSWLPFFAISLCFATIPGISYTVALAAKWLGYSSASISPLVYTILDRRLKRAVIKSLRSMKHFLNEPLSRYLKTVK